MTAATIFGIAVVALMTVVYVAGRLSARHPSLGSVSQSWLVEERASEANRT